MDQDEKLIPKHLQKYKTPEARERRKEWLRKYHKNRYHLKKLGDETMPKENTELNKEIIPVKQVPEVKEDDFQKMLKGFQEITAPTGGIEEDDPVIKTINKYAKYVPLVIQFMQGFSQAAQAYNYPQQQAAVQQNKIQPPQGYWEMSPTQRLARKYDGAGNITNWYQQVIAYEEAMDNLSIQRGVQSHRPVPMERTIHGQSNAQNMNDLKKRAESEQWDKKEEMNLSKAKEVKRTDGQPSSINEAIGMQKEEPKQDNEVKASEILQNVNEQLTQDNARYIQMFMTYIKNRTTTEFGKDLKNAEETVNNFVNSWGWAIPAQTRGLIKSLLVEQLEEMVKEADPKKIEYIEKHKLKPKLQKLFTELQAKL